MDYYHHRNLYSSDEEAATSSYAATASTKRGNAKGAATLRISDDMTVSQLQDECRTRGVGGYSGKNKDYLLDLLGAGTIWQAMMSKKKPAAKKGGVGNPKKAPPKKKGPVAKQTKAKKPAAAKGTSTNWNNFPKVDANLTVTQLTHELLHRQPTVKGTSKKPKSWFLDRLGENSIWTTSPEVDSTLVTAESKVSSGLTVAQLTHELLSRGSTATGISKKSKADLLHLVGEGSIWTTVPPFGGDKKPTKMAAASKKQATKKAPAKKANKSSSCGTTNHQYKVGDRVMVKGLVETTEYNGEFGTIEQVPRGPKHPEMRYTVVLESYEYEGQEITVRPRNMEPANYGSSKKRSTGGSTGFITAMKRARMMHNQGSYDYQNDAEDEYCNGASDEEYQGVYDHQDGMEDGYSDSDEDSGHDEANGMFCGYMEAQGHYGNYSDEDGY